jgi:hypothetical protein
MSIFLYANGRTINLKLVKDISIIDRSVKLDDFLVYCEEYEVAQLLHNDISSALKAGKKAWIEAFTGQDKYSLLKMDVLMRRLKEEERSKTAIVVNMIEKKATQCFRVKAHLLVSITTGHPYEKPFTELKNRNIDSTVYAQDESIVKAWVGKHHGQICTLDIIRREDCDVFACYRQPPINLNGFSNVEILDAKDYEAQKETT